MPKLTAVIITYNEGNNIGKCLESVRGLVDEVVVVDSFSTDNTESICRKFGAKFIQHVFEGHIEQKNFAVSQASYDYILSLDADELLSEDLKKSILEVKENWQYDGYSFKRLTNYCGKWIKHTSWYPSKKLRLWDRRKGKWGGRNPHDKFILQAGATRKDIAGDLLHYSYNNINEHIDQINYFSSIIAREYFKENIRIKNFQIIYHSLWRFLRDYFIKLGFLDGLYGLIISVNSSFETYLKYSKLKYMNVQRSLSEKNTICFVNSVKSWGGGEKWHLDISKRLHEKGYKILLISSPESELFIKANQEKISSRTIHISNLSFLNPIKIFLISRMLKKEKVGTLLINLSADLKAVGIAGRLAGVNHIIYRRGSALPVRNTFLNRFLYRKIATKIIANSLETKRTILLNNPYFIAEDKITVIYNGIDLKTNVKKNFPNLYTRNGNEFLIGNAGRLSEEKGQIYLIDLAKTLKIQGYKFKILIAGRGKLESKLKKYAKNNGVEDEVIFLGFLENMDWFNELIDLFVLTSLYEGFGYVLVEAMAKQKPVVAFDICSSSEIIIDNQTGFLVEKANVKQLAQKVEVLMQDEKLRKKMGIQGLKRVEEVFTINKTIEKVESLLGQEFKNEEYP